jgi:hypothetical protein
MQQKFYSHVTLLVIEMQHPLDYNADQRRAILRVQPNAMELAMSRSLTLNESKISLSLWERG